MNGGDGQDSGELESELDDSSQSPGGPARSGFFGWYTFSGVVHNIVNKFSRVVPKTAASPPVTAVSPTRSQANVEHVGQDRLSELRDRSGTRPASFDQMNLGSMSSDGSRVVGVRGVRSDVGGVLGRPLTPNSSSAYPQFRKESSILTKSSSNTVVHSPSPFSRPVGQMPAVHLSPRQRPQLRNEDRAKPVMVKIAQPDPLRTSLIRHKSFGEYNKNNSSKVESSTSVTTEAVVDALKKRKRSHLEPDENETRDLEGNAQLSKRKCSRDDDLSAAETPMSRGMKRRALHDGFGNADDTTDQAQDVVEGAIKKICQNLSPSTPSSGRVGCGARNIIDASYSSHQRWEERIMRAKSQSQVRSASSQDESMPLVEDSRPASSRTSRCSSRFSRPSRANSPMPQDEDLRSAIRSDRPHSTQSSDRSTPLNLLSRLHNTDSVQRAPVLLRDGSIKNRVTMLSSTLSSSPSVTPSPDLGSQLTESNEMKATVEFTADDFERDRDLLNSRASRLLLGIFGADDETDGKPASTEPLPTTSSSVLGSSSTMFQASGAAPVSASLASGTAPESAILVAGATGSQVQTNADTGITSANVLKSGIDGATLSASTAVLQNPSVSTSAPDQSGLASSIAPSFSFGSSKGAADPSASPAVSTIAVSSTSTLSTTLGSFAGSQLNPGKSFEPSESGQKGFSTGTLSLGTFPVPSSGAPVEGRSANSLNGLSFGSGALASAVASTTTSVVSAFGAASNVQTTVVSFGNTNNTGSKTATLSAVGDTRVTSGFFGNAVGGASPFGDATVAATNATTATKDNALMTAGGFPFGKLSSTQATADNLGNSKPLAVTAQATASDLSFGNSSTVKTTAGLGFGSSGIVQTTANSFAFGSSGTIQPTANSFSFPNSGANQTTASSFAFGNSANAQTTASNSVFGNLGALQTTANSFGNLGAPQTTASSFGNLGALQTTASSFSLGNSGPSQTPAPSFAFGNSGTLQTTASSLPIGTSQTTANSFSFGNSGASQTSASGLSFGNSGNTQTTASNFSFGNSGGTQSAGGGFPFGNASTNPAAGSISGSVATTASVFAFGNSNSKQMVGGPFGNSGSTQTTANSGFGGIAATPQFSFGTSSVSTTANPSTASSFSFGNIQQQASGTNLTTANPFGNSLPAANAFGSNSATSNTFGNSATTASTFGGSTVTTANVFGSSTGVVNAFGKNVAAANAFGNNAATASTFGNNAATASTFGSNSATASTFGSNSATASTFGSNVTTASTFSFGGNPTTANAFGSNATTASTFGSTQPPSNPFNTGTAVANPFGGNMATANPFGTPNNNAGLQFNRPDVAATNPQSTPQDLRRVLFPSTPGNNSTPGASLPAAPTQQQQGFNFFGSKTDGNSNSVNSPGGFAFGKNPTPAPTFGSNSTAGGFAFGKTAAVSNPPQPANQGFNFQGATQSGSNSQMPNTGFGFSAGSQPGTNSQQTPNTGFNFQGAVQPGTNPQAASNTGFNFNAAAPNFAFGQMPNPAANGLPSIGSFSTGPKFTPGTAQSSSSTGRSHRTKKKTR